MSNKVHQLTSTIEQSPNVLEYVDEAGGWAARLDFMLLLFLTVLAIKARLRWSPKHVGKASRYVWQNLGFRGFLLSLGSPVLIDFLIFPLQAIGGLRIADKKKSKWELKCEALETRIIELEQQID